MRPKVPSTLTNDHWHLFWHYTTGSVESIRLQDDPTRMEWSRGRFGMPYGACFLDKRETREGGVRLTYEYMVDLRLTVDRYLVGEEYREEYVWQNVGKKPVEIKEKEVGVYVTFAERGERSDVFVARRAYTHILSGSRLYMASSRADGTLGGLALTSTEGEIAEVKEEYPTASDRGELVAYMPPKTLSAGEEIKWGWVIYDYTDDADYAAKTARYAPVWRICPLWGEEGENVRFGTNESESESAVFVKDKTRLEWNGEYVVLPSLSVWRKVQQAKGGRGGNTTLYDAYLLAKLYRADPDAKIKAQIQDLLSRYYKRGRNRLDMTPYDAAEIAGLTSRLTEQIRFALSPRRAAFNPIAEWGRYCLLCEGEWLEVDGAKEARDKQIAVLTPFLHAPWGDYIEGWQRLEVMAKLLGKPD